MLQPSLLLLIQSGHLVSWQILQQRQQPAQQQRQASPQEREKTALRGSRTPRRSALAAVGAKSRRLGDRIAMPFVALHESAIGRFCWISPLRSFLVSDSVAVRRFATGAGYDGAADSRPGTVFLFISSR